MVSVSSGTSCMRDSADVPEDLSLCRVGESHRIAGPLCRCGSGVPKRRRRDVVGLLLGIADRSAVREQFPRRQPSLDDLTENLI